VAGGQLKLVSAQSVGVKGEELARHVSGRQDAFSCGRKIEKKVGENL
jgi:hypothetical protein